MLARVQRLCVSQMAASSERILITREMAELEDEVWDNLVDVLHRRLLSHPRKGVLKDALTVRARAEVRTSRLAESVGDGSADAVVIVLDIFHPARPTP
jgi:hypothetical protein